MRPLLAAPLLATTPAHAGCLTGAGDPCPPYLSVPICIDRDGVCEIRIRPRTGDASIDRAMAICDAHAIESAWVYATSPSDSAPDWQPPYRRACVVWLGRWQASDAARQARERDAREAEDLRWLNSGAGVEK